MAVLPVDETGSAATRRCRVRVAANGTPEERLIALEFLDDGPRDYSCPVHFRRSRERLFRMRVRFEPVSLRMLSHFVEENQPVLALSVAWPLLIGTLLATDSMARVTAGGALSRF